MNSEEKQLQLLGLALRASQLITGEEMTIRSIQKNEAKLVLVASDASDNTKKKMMNKCQFYKIPIFFEHTSEEISQAIGKSRSICAFTDKGFAESYNKLKGTRKI